MVAALGVGRLFKHQYAALWPLFSHAPMVDRVGPAQTFSLSLAGAAVVLPSGEHVVLFFSLCGRAVDAQPERAGNDGVAQGRGAAALGHDALW